MDSLEYEAISHDLNGAGPRMIVGIGVDKSEEDTEEEFNRLDRRSHRLDYSFIPTYLASYYRLIPTLNNAYPQTLDWWNPQVLNS